MEGSETDLSQSRRDFWAVTSNKQLNFLQHVVTLMKPGARCAIVVPDNVLFEGGSGEIIRRRLLEHCTVHTLLRLPPGIFYAQGVKANVLFFDREKSRRDAPLWVYDLRTNKHFTLRQQQIQRSDFDEFVSCFRPGAQASRKPTWSEVNRDGRWRKFTQSELLARPKANLDVLWLREEESRSANQELPPPKELAASIANELRIALEHFQKATERLSQ
jgi:type I restriction enzyme M protein